MNRFLGIIAFVALTNGVWGQSTQNPFDLKYREAKPSTTKEQVQTVIQKDSVRDVVSSDTVINFSPQQEIVNPDTQKASMFGGNNDSSLPGQNPFETAESTDTAGMVSGSSNEIADEKKDSSIPVTAKKQYVSRGFQIFFLLFSILFLIFIVNVERSFIRDLWRVISNENYSSLHHRNQRNTMRQILLLMGYLIFIFQAGLFINQSLHIYQYAESVLSSLWVSIAVVLGVYLVRHAVIRYLKWLFNNEKELSLYAFDISIFNTMVGLILLPINILLVFGPDAMYKTLVIIGIATILVAYLLRQLRWMVASRRFIINSLFLFFIYLCAVEILPLWTISKIFW